MHAAWHCAWCWEPLIAELVKRGHGAMAMDLPCEDPSAGPVEYAEAAAASIVGFEEARRSIMAAHSSTRWARLLYNRCPPEIARLVLPRLVLAAWSRASVAKDLAHGAWVEMDCDHFPMLGRPAELADVLSAIRT